MYVGYTNSLQSNSWWDILVWTKAHLVCWHGGSVASIHNFQHTKYSVKVCYRTNLILSNLMMNSIINLLYHVACFCSHSIYCIAVSPRYFLCCSSSWGFLHYFQFQWFLGEFFLLLVRPPKYSENATLDYFLHYPFKFHVCVFCELCFTLSPFHQYTFAAWGQDVQ